MGCMDKKCELGDTSEETSAVDNLVYPSSSLVDSSLVDSSIRVYYLAACKP
jgi:hypothetical protein